MTGCIVEPKYPSVSQAPVQNLYSYSCHKSKETIGTRDRFTFLSTYLFNLFVRPVSSGLQILHVEQYDHHGCIVSKSCAVAQPFHESQRHTQCLRVTMFSLLRAARSSIRIRFRHEFHEILRMA